ncbi:MAG: hypothetical protein R3E96_09665 [Planctomycetota bacterium]
MQRQEEYRREKLRGEQRRLAELDAHLFAFRAGDETRSAALVQTLGNGDAIGASRSPCSKAPCAPTSRPWRVLQGQRGVPRTPRSRTQRELVVRRGVLVGALDAALQGVQDRVAAQLEECNLIEADLVAWPEQDRQNLTDSRDRL